MAILLFALCFFTKFIAQEVDFDCSNLKLDQSNYHLINSLRCFSLRGTNFVVITCEPWAKIRTSYRNPFIHRDTDTVYTQEKNLAINIDSVCMDNYEFCEKIANSKTITVGLNKETTVRCNDGYEFGNDRTVMCVIDETNPNQGYYKLKSTNERVRECTKKNYHCPAIVPDNFDAIYSDTLRTIGSAVSITCHTGYYEISTPIPTEASGRVKHVFTFACTENKQWINDRNENANLVRCVLQPDFCPDQSSKSGYSLGAYLVKDCPANTSMREKSHRAKCSLNPTEPNGFTGVWIGDENCYPNPSIATCNMPILLYRENRTINCTGSSLNNTSVWLDDGQVPSENGQNWLTVNFQERYFSRTGGIHQVSVKNDLTEFVLTYPFKYKSSFSSQCNSETEYYDVETNRCSSCKDVEGAVCDVESRLVPVQGYWSSMLNMRPHRCPNRFACLVPNITETQLEICNLEIGHHGELCDECGVDFFYDNISCYRCKLNGSYFIPLGVSLIYYLAISCALTFFPSLTYYIWASLMFLAQLSTGLRYLLVSKSISLEFLIALDFLNFKLEYLKMYCNEEKFRNFTNIFQFQLAFVVIVFIVMMAPPILRWYVCRKSKKLCLIDIVTKNIFLLLTLFYTSLTSLFMGGVSCQHNLLDDAAEKKYQSHYLCSEDSTRTTIISGLLFAIFSVCVPLYLMIVHFIFVRSGNYVETEISPHYRIYGVFFSKLSAKSWFHLGTFFLMGIVFSIQPILYHSASIYFILVYIFGIANGALCFVVKPYKLYLHNICFVSANLLMIFILSVVALHQFSYFPYWHDGIKYFVYAFWFFLAISIILIFAFAAYNVIKYYKKCKNSINVDLKDI